MSEEYVFKTTPYSYQYKVWLDSRDKREWALLLDMGCGKSKITIDTIGYLTLKKEINAVLIVAPNNVHRQWVKSEIPLHLPDNIPHEITLWDSSQQSRKYVQQLKSVFQPGPLKILAMNVEAFSTKTGADFANKFLDRWPHNMLVVDESSKIKSVSAKRTKNILKLRLKSKYRRILTGTPVTQCPLDIYPQFSFLNPEILGYTSYVAFKTQYAIIIKNNAVDGGGRLYTYEQVVGYRRLDELADKVSKASSRLLKKDCLDLPEKIYQHIPIAMSEVQSRLYQKLKEDLLLEVQGQDIPIPLVLTQLLRLQQIVGGHVAQDDGTAIPIEGPNPKLNTLMDEIESLAETDKVIIWARFRPEIQLITKTLQEKYGADSAGAYFGGVSGSDRADLIDRFMHGGLRFFVANTQCAGLGLNLTAANIVYYFSNTFALEDRLQSEDRCHRVGTKHNVVYKDLLCVGTIDEKIHSALSKKKSIADIITGDGIQAIF